MGKPLLLLSIQQKSVTSNPILAPKPFPIPLDSPTMLAFLTFVTEDLFAKGIEENPPPIRPTIPPAIPLIRGKASFSVMEPFDNKAEGRAKIRAYKPPVVPPLRIASRATFLVGISDCLLGRADACARLLVNANMERQKNHFFVHKHNLIVFDNNIFQL